MDVTGHKTRSVFERYNIVDERDMREAMHRVWEYLNGGQEQNPHNGEGANPR